MELFDRAMYLQLLSFFIGYFQQGDGEEMDRLERFEACREAARTILGVTGIHRLTSILGEFWQLSTALKIYGASMDALDAPAATIAGAAPSPHLNDLQALGVQLQCCSILEEETATFLDWLDDLESEAEIQGKTEVLQWLQDLRFVVSAAHFALVH